MWFESVKQSIYEFLEIPAVRNAISIILIVIGIVRIFAQTDIGKKTLRRIEAYSKQTIENLKKTIVEKDDEIKKIKEQYEQKINELIEQYEKRLDVVNEKVEHFEKSYTEFLKLIPNKKLQDKINEYESGGNDERES